MMKPYFKPSQVKSSLTNWDSLTTLKFQAKRVKNRLDEEETYFGCCAVAVLCELVAWLQICFGVVGIVVFSVIVSNCDEFDAVAQKSDPSAFSTKLYMFGRSIGYPGLWALSILQLMNGLQLLVGTLKEVPWVLSGWSFYNLFLMIRSIWTVCKAVYSGCFGWTMVPYLIHIPVALVVVTLVEIRSLDIKAKREAAESRRTQLTA